MAIRFARLAFRDILKTLLGIAALVIWVGYMVLNLSWQEHLDPLETSRFVSFGRGRLGNQMSSVATLIAFSQKFNVDPFVTREQAELLWGYFEDLDLNVLEDEMPNYQAYKWKNPFRLIDEKILNYDYSILFSPEGSNYLFGQTIDVGQYPNEVHLFKEILPSLKSLFRMKDRFVLNAQRNLELSRTEFLEKRKTFQRNSEELEGSHVCKFEDISFVSVHIRRGDYAGHLKTLYQVGYVKLEYYFEAIEWFKGALKVRWMIPKPEHVFQSMQCKSRLLGIPSCIDVADKLVPAAQAVSETLAFFIMSGVLKSMHAIDTLFSRVMHVVTLERHESKTELFVLTESIPEMIS